MKYMKLFALMAIFCFALMAFPQHTNLTYSAEASVISDSVTNETEDSVPGIVSLIFVAITISVVALVISVLFGLMSFKKR